MPPQHLVSDVWNWFLFLHQKHGFDPIWFCFRGLPYAECKVLHGSQLNAQKWKAAYAYGDILRVLFFNK